MNRALAWRNMIKDFRITEIEKSDIDETKVKRVFYVIQGKIFPYIKDGTFYGPNDEIKSLP